MGKRILKTRQFARWMRGTELTDEVLRDVAGEMAGGLLGASLGGNVYKKRVALPGRGKSGGARTIIATSLRDRYFFMFGFQKNEMEDIGGDDLKAFKKMAHDYLASSEAELRRMLELGKLVEVQDG